LTRLHLATGAFLRHGEYRTRRSQHLINATTVASMRY
jgi:hypothetical protein